MVRMRTKLYYACSISLYYLLFEQDARQTTNKSENLVIGLRPFFEPSPNVWLLFHFRDQFFQLRRTYSIFVKQFLSLANLTVAQRIKKMEERDVRKNVMSARVIYT